MYCSKCGKQASVGDVYCSACGARLRTEQEEMRRKKRLARIVTLVLAAAVAIGGAATLLRSRPEPDPVQQSVHSQTSQTQETVPATAQSAPSEAPAVPETVPAQTAEPEAPAEPALFLAREAVEDNGATWENTYRYDTSGRIAREQTGDGYVHTYSYRSDGTLEKEGISFGEEPTGVILYDEHGNPVKESDLLGDVKTYNNTYDNQNRLISSEKYDAQGILEETFYTYGEDGSYTLDHIDHAEGMMHCHKFTSYDPEGRVLTRSQDLESGMPIEILTENVYDIFGNLERTEYTYKDGDTSIHCITEYINTCNADGLLEAAEVYVTEHQTVRGETMEFPRKLEKTVLYTYDNSSRLIGQEERGADNGWQYTYTWEYDEQGNLVSRTEDDGNIRHTYEYLPLDMLMIY